MTFQKQQMDLLKEQNKSNFAVFCRREFFSITWLLSSPISGDIVFFHTALVGVHYLTISESLFWRRYFIDKVIRRIILNLELLTARTARSQPGQFGQMVECSFANKVVGGFLFTLPISFICYGERLVHYWELVRFDF